ncbi:hypothetical protein Tco_1456799 [Tanacetum coccineum]
MPEHIKQTEWKETKHVKYVKIFKLYLISLIISCHHTIFHMAQHVLPVAQLVPQYKPIGRCNNYARTVSKIPDTEDTIKFMLDTQQFSYTVDMFCDTLHLPVETLENSFVTSANIHTIEVFMNKVGYQGVVDKVSAFYMKNLAQPWQTMFKVFNRCLTTRTSGHDQTKINILQLFHVVLNQTHVDYAALLWWDFMNNVFQKKEAIQYPRFIKLIIADLMKKFPNISKRIDEDYHSIKDDIPLVSVYTTGNVSVRGMLIPDAFLTAEIRETNDFKEYEMVFMKVDVPMNQSQPVVSTQGTHRITPSAHKSPTVSASPPVSKKRKQIAGESSSPRKSLKITITQKQIVEKDDDDSEDRIEPGSHKDNPEVVDDDDDKERETKDDEMGSLEIRNEETQTTIPTPLSSPRKILSSDKKTSQELTDIVSNPTTTTSKHSQVKKRISSKYSHIPGALRRMCRRQGYMIQDMERKCVTTAKFWETHNKIDDILHEVVPQIAENVTNDLIEANLKPCIVNTIIEDRDAFRSQVPDFVSKEFKAHAPAIIAELFKNHVQSNVIHVHPTTTTSTETESSANLQYQLYLKMKRNLQDRANDIALWEALRCKFEKSSTYNTSFKEDDFHSYHDEHQDDDAPPEGRKDQHQEWDAWEEENVIDEDEVISEDVTPELIAEFQNIDKRVPTIFDHARMEATLRDSLSNLSRNAEEYADHLEQSTNFMENQIVWESRQPDIPRTIPKNLIFYGPQRNPNEPPRLLYNKDLFFLKYGNIEEKKYILSLHKIHAEEFPEPDLEEKITEVVRIVTDQPHGLDFMEQILVIRANDEPDSFSKADFKYLNKNDIEDLYYLCRSKDIDNQKVKLMNSLITFIRSCVIWERVHDFQLRIESYQMKVNLTAPTLTFLGFEKRAPYTIVDEPQMGLIYLNNKNEKRVMYLEKIVKFCDATLEKVLNEVKLRMFESKFLKKPPLLGSLRSTLLRADSRWVSGFLECCGTRRRIGSRCAVLNTPFALSWCDGWGGLIPSKSVLGALSNLLLSIYKVSKRRVEDYGNLSVFLRVENRALLLKVGLPTRVNLAVEGVLLDSICVLLCNAADGGMFSMFSFDVTLARVVLVKLDRCGIWNWQG